MSFCLNLLFSLPYDKKLAFIFQTPRGRRPRGVIKPREKNVRGVLFTAILIYHRHFGFDLESTVSVTPSPKFLDDNVGILVSNQLISQFEDEVVWSSKQQPHPSLPPDKCYSLNKFQPDNMELWRNELRLNMKKESGGRKLYVWMIMRQVHPPGATQ